MSIERFDVDQDGYMVPAADGEYVRYDDLAVVVPKVTVERPPLVCPQCHIELNYVAYGNVRVSCPACGHIIET